ncbi:EmrB/QacA subfamily drug resistance transporter [Actinocorallia herbida]|uniref:EmrB/QacA subfamily drug resistance transporter n=1 Tax=Actinocorallia herbida TaxID=58109 RepID=A0A3N1CT24_9ACTN|nr:MFS transporter [Actinocorallia herbida]ROO84467.1 EmrB/QacA subfamily drug resistance transporter [Actinocorallia herbida]
MTTVSAPGAPVGAEGARRGTMPVLLTATFMTTLDVFIVNVALPALRDDLGAGTAALEWVVAGFGLALASGLITGGRLGDLFGRRRVLGIGLALFTAASVLCGLASSPGVLIAGRIAQGLAAALLTPQVLAVLRTAYSGTAQAKAFGGYGLAMGLGAVFGQLIGGLLIEADLFGLGWRACFLINLPVGAGALLLLARVPESRGPARGFDPVGAGLAALGLALLVLPLIEGRAHGWPWWTWACLAAACAVLAVFVRQERRAADPVVPLGLFGERAFSAGLAATLVLWLGQSSFFLILAMELQLGHGLSALEAGTLFTAVGGGYVLVAMKAHVLAERLGRQVIALGAVLMAVGLAGMWAAAGHGLVWLLPGMVVDGIGMGMALAPLTGTVLARIAPAHAGAAGGVLATVNQVGNALGVAVISILFFGAADVTAGFRDGVAALVVVELALAGVIQLLPRR